MSVSEFMALTTAVTGFMGSVFGVLALRRIWLRILLGIVALILAGGVVVLAIPAYQERWMWLLAAWSAASVIVLSLWFVGSKYRDPRDGRVGQDRHGGTTRPSRGDSGRRDTARREHRRGDSARRETARGDSALRDLHPDLDKPLRKGRQIPPRTRDRFQDRPR